MMKNLYIICILRVLSLENEDSITPNFLKELSDIFGISASSIEDKIKVYRDKNIGGGTVHFFRNFCEVFGFSELDFDQNSFVIFNMYFVEMYKSLNK